MLENVRRYLRYARAVATRPYVRRAVLADLADAVLRRRDPSTPPRRLMLTVGSQTAEGFRREGVEMMERLIDPGGLRPEHDVLDVGCGAGRVAIPLTGYLTGRYEGFDVLAAGVRWCQRSITPRHPNFRFRIADVRSRHYNPRGRHEPSAYRFPHDDRSFDFAFHASVLTHLTPAAARNYVRETARVLRAGGTCFATFLLLDSERRALADRGALPFNFRARYPDHWTVHADDPEAVVAYWTGDVIELFEEAGFEPAVHRGNWAGERGGLTWQDVILARRV